MPRKPRKPPSDDNQVEPDLETEPGNVAARALDRVDALLGAEKEEPGNVAARALDRVRALTESPLDRSLRSIMERPIDTALHTALHARGRALETIGPERRPIDIVRRALALETTGPDRVSRYVLDVVERVRGLPGRRDILALRESMGRSAVEIAGVRVVLDRAAALAGLRAPFLETEPDLETEPEPEPAPVALPASAPPVKDAPAVDTLARPFRAPLPVAEMMVQLRAGGPMEVRPSSGETFSAPTADRGGAWYVTPGPGSDLSLGLPFGLNGAPPDLAPGSAALRTLLSGGMLRAWLLAWAQWHVEGCQERGLFSWSARGVLRSFVSHRNATGAMRVRLKHDFKILQSLRLTHAEGFTLRTPEAMIQRITNQSGDALYRHAPLALDLVIDRGRFLQVPHAVLRIDARGDLPLALGLAALWRVQIGAASEGPGHVRSALGPLLSKLGEDVQRGARDMGATAYFDDRAKRLKKAAAAGDLGTVHVRGEGPEAVVTLSPSPVLQGAYQGLLDARKARRAAGHLGASLLESPEGRAALAGRRPRRTRRT